MAKNTSIAGDLLEEHEAKVAALRAALTEAERSGEPRPFDCDEFVREQRAFDNRRHH